MGIRASSLLKTAISTVGAAAAGPAGAIIGQLAGGLLGASLPGIAAFLSEVSGSMASDAITGFSDKIVERLTPPETQRINHDLQTAFQDAVCEALYDVGGSECFPEVWRAQPRDVPAEALFSRSSAGRTLWRGGSPLAAQAAECLQEMEQAIRDQELIPLDPPRDQPAAGVQVYLQAETSADLNRAFHCQVIQPFLMGYPSLLAELPELEAHLEHHLLDRALVHLGEMLKARTPAWRAFNRAVLDELRVQVSALGAGQEKLLAQLDALAPPQNEGPFSDRLAELISGYGRLEKELAQGLGELSRLAVDHHREEMERLAVLASSSQRIETKVERVLRFLEDGRWVIEGPQLTATAEEPAPGEPPFKGMCYFEEGDFSLFYGREQLTARLASLLAEQPVLAVIGASGSGKSSLVRAGLIPALRRGELLDGGVFPPSGSSRWPIFLMTPTAHPVDALAACLTRSSESVRAAAVLIEDLRADPRSLELFAHRLVDPAGSSSRVLVVVDQFEELFTQCRDSAERQAFIDALLQPASRGAGSLVSVVITLRADFYASCAQYPQLREALSRWQVFIGPMDPTEVRRAIEEPARLGGWSFEPGLVDLILHDIGAVGGRCPEPGALPLLSHALLETWNHRRGRMMTLESYAESGGVRQAIAHTAESIYQHRLTGEQRAVARQIFLRLTELGEGTQDTRRRARLEEFATSSTDPSAVEAVLGLLTEARLVTAAEDTVEVAHEALIREWPTLQRWLEEDRESIHIHRRLTEAAGEWQRSGRDEDLLFRGARLAEAGEWSQAHSGDLNALELAFLQESQSLHQSELDLARRRAEEQAQVAARMRRRSIYLAGALLAAAALLVAALLLWGQAGDNARAAEAASTLAVAQQNNAVAQRSTAEAASTLAVAQEAAALAERNAAVQARQTAEAFARESRAGQLAGLSDNYRDSYFVTSLLLSARAYDLDDSAQTRSSLLAGLEYNPRIVRYLNAHSKNVRGLALSPDGKSLASGGADGRVFLWQPGGAREPAAELSAPAPLGAVSALRFSGDSRYLAAGGEDGTVILWDFYSGATTPGYPIDWQSATHVTDQGEITDFAFSPDGRILVFASKNGWLFFWNTETRRFLYWDRYYRVGHPEEVDPCYSLAVSPDGQSLACGAYGRVMTWKMAGLSTGDGLITSIELVNNDDKTSQFMKVAFSPDNQALLAAAYSGQIDLWDVNTGQPVWLEYDTMAWTPSFAFSRDGSKIYTSRGNSLQVRDIATGKITWVSAFDNNAAIQSMALLADGATLLLGMEDGSIIEYMISDDRFFGERHYRTFSSVDGVAFVGNEQVLSISDLGFLYVRDLFNRQEKYYSIAGFASTAAPDEQGYDPWLWPAQHFSPDGALLASVSIPNHTITLVEVPGGEVRAGPLGGFTGRVLSLAFSPDGSLFAASDANGAVQIWDARSGALAHRFDSTWITGLAFSPDGKTLAAASDTFILLYDLAGQTARELPVEAEGGIHALAFSPDGKRLAYGGHDYRVYLLDVAAGQPSGKPLNAHTGSIEALAFSPDGSMLASGGFDRRIILWDMREAAFGRQTGPPLEGHGDFVTTLAFSPDGKKLVSGGKDGYIFLWDVDPGLWRARICYVAGRDLTSSEWQMFLPGQEQSEVCAPDAQMYADQAWWLLELGQYRSAAEVFSRVIALQPNNGQAYFGRGLAYFNQGEAALAVSEFETAMSVDPSLASPQLYSRLGWAAFASQNVEKALEYFGKQIELSPQSEEGYESRGYIHYTQGAYEETIADIEKAMSIKPRSGNYLYNLEYLATAHIALLNSEEAQNYIQEIIEAHNWEGRGFYRVGIILSNLKMDELALTYLEQAVETDPKLVEGYAQLFGYFSARGDFAKATEYLTRGIEQNPNSADLYSYRGFCRDKLGLYQEAIADLNRAIALDEKYVNDTTMNNLGVAYLKLKEYHTALIYLHRAIQLNSRVPNPYHWLADAYYELEQRDKALYYYQKFVELSPEGVEDYVTERIDELRR